MMQWQVNRQFRKDCEAVIARIPNPDAVVQQLDLPYGPLPELAWPYQERHARQRGGALPVQERQALIRPEGPAPGRIQQNQPEPQPIPQPVAPQDQPLALLPEPPAVLPYKPKMMDPNPFPPPARGRRGRGGNYPFANNDRNRQGANWRNHPYLEEQEEHREEVLPRPYRAEPRIDYAQPEQGQNLLPINVLNDVGALQRMIREMMEPEARRGERPTQCIAIENNPLLKLRLFGNSLSGQAFTWFRKLKMKCRIPMEERHFIQMAQDALKISLRKRFDGMLFGDLAKLADKASKYEELLREEQQKRNSSKGTYYKSPSSSIHMIEVESEEDAEG
ncbi:unnamed protein product [Prunus armeniaca]